MPLLSIFQVPPVIRVDFPALDNLVNYLRENSQAQAEIDVLTNQLKSSNDALQRVEKSNL